MDTPSPKPQSWEQLTRSAQSAPMPEGIDMRVAIRAEISATRAADSVFDDVVRLCGSRWLQTSFAVLALAAFFSCHESLDIVNEMAWIWQLQGPVLAGI